MPAGPTVEGVPLPGVHLVGGARHVDERGVLRKVLSRPAPADPAGLVVDEVLTTSNPTAGTVRGMHYQVAPHAQSKTLWVTGGALYDVLVDLRADEQTYGAWMAVRLSEDDDTALHIPAGIAHGYQTLTTQTSLTYLVSGVHSPECERTLRWDDPFVAIDWPLPVSLISAKDRQGLSWPPR